MAKKTLISLSKRNDGLHNIALNYDDATVEAITDAVIELVKLHRMTEGDTLTVGVVNVAETLR